MSEELQWRTYGKCILTGEHSVLRGCPALVLPVRSRQFLLRQRPGAPGLVVEGKCSEEYRDLFLKLLDHIQKTLKPETSPLAQKLEIQTNLPIGSGLGASAALSVAISRWLAQSEHINQSEVFDFAKSLEDLFHGESSGVDIAVALTGEPLKFVRGHLKEPLSIKWEPHWHISHTGHRGSTKKCVKQVTSLKNKDPELFVHLDQKMAEASTLAEKALQSPDESAGFENLAQALAWGRECFEKWGLVTDQMRAHMQILKEAGAKEVKPTGSGLGGYVISLWEATPPATEFQLISLG